MEKKQPKDPQLDSPSVANETKHINFLEQEEKARQAGVNIDLQNQEDEERQKQWKQGIEEGKREQRGESPFQKRGVDEPEED